MGKYPETIAVDDLPKWAHISDEEILRDIVDTEAEVAQWEAIAIAQQSIADHTPHEMERKMADFKALGYGAQVSQGRDMIAFLVLLLATRKEASANV